MSLYEAKYLWSEGSQMITADSNDLSILSAYEDIDIFDETGEIRVLERRQGPLIFLCAFVFFVTQTVHPLQPGRGFQ